MDPKVEFLSSGQIYAILGEAYILLEELGITLHHEGLLRRLGDYGCEPDMENHHVKLKKELVEWAVQQAPHSIKLYDLEGENYSYLGDGAVNFTPGSAAIKMSDPFIGEIRLATCRDMIDFAVIIDALEHIAYSATSIVPSDVPEDIADSLRLYALLKTTKKAIVTGAFTMEGCERMLKMLMIARGSWANLAEKPLAIFSACPTAPLKWSDVTADNTRMCAERQVPVEFISMPLSGFMAPISLTGSLIQHTAETLSGVVLSQVSNPGAPILWGGSPGTFDMRTMAPLITSVEAQMMDCAYAQIGKALKLPTQAYIGLSDSKIFDPQAGFESGTGMYLAAMAGINSVSGPGMLFFESAFCLEKLVFDNEVCGMAKKLKLGIHHGEDDFPSIGIFRELIQEQNLLTSESTLKHLHDAHYIPGPVIDRATTSDGKEIATRASEVIDELFKKYEQPDILSKEQHEALNSMIPEEVHQHLKEA